MNDLKLFAIFRMAGPCTLHLKDFTRHRINQIADDSYQIPVTMDLDLGNGKPVLLVGVCDSLNLTGKIGKHRCPLAFAPI